MTNNKNIFSKPVWPKVNCIILLFLIPFFSLPSVQVRAQAQWIQSTGLYGGQIYDLTADGNELYATTKSDVFRSTDSGLTWSALNAGMVGSINAVAASGNALVVGGYYGIKWSNDHGLTWNLNESLGSIAGLAVAGTNFFALSNSDVYISADGGATWTRIKAGTIGTQLNTLFTSGTDLFVGGFFDGVYRSANSGSSPWVAIPSAARFIRAFAKSGTDLYIGGDFGGVFKSSDNGATWQEKKSGLPASPITALEVQGDNLYATTNSGIYKSSNGGDSWTPTSVLPDGAYGTCLASIGNNIFVGTTAGLRYSTNGGVFWLSADTGVVGTSVNSIVEFGSQLFCATMGSGIFRSIDGGSTWSLYNVGIGDLYITSLVKNGNTLLASARGGWGGLFRLTDNGGPWTSVSTPFSQVISLGVIDGKIYASTIGKIYRSDNNGTSWIEVSTGLKNDVVIITFTSVRQTVFAGGYSNGNWLFKTENNGTQWTQLDATAMNGVSRLLVKGDTLFAATGGGLFRSTDIGKNWNSINTNLPQGALNCLSVTADNKHIFIGTRNGVYATDSKSINWFPFRSGFSQTPTIAQSFILIGNKLLAGTDGAGIWSTTLEHVVPEPVIAAVPHVEVNSVVVYPNPAKDKITIDLTSLEPKKPVEVSIYDIYGRKLQHELAHTGADLMLDVNAYSKGVYILRVVQLNKIVQVKFAKD